MCSGICHLYKYLSLSSPHHMTGCHLSKSFFYHSNANTERTFWIGPFSECWNQDKNPQLRPEERAGAQHHNDEATGSTGVNWTRPRWASFTAASSANEHPLQFKGQCWSLYCTIQEEWNTKGGGWDWSNREGWRFRLRHQVSVSGFGISPLKGRKLMPVQVMRMHWKRGGKRGNLFATWLKSKVSIELRQKRIICW